MRVRDLINKASAALGKTDNPATERRETRGRRSTDRTIVPVYVKYAWAGLVTVLVLTSTVLGENSKHARTVDYLIRSLTGVSIETDGTKDTNP